MHVNELHIHDFRQFKNVDIKIGSRITAIVGNNGTGKSTILGILANSSELKSHKTYLGKPYRGEFSELFRASLAHDPKGPDRVSLDILLDGEPQTVWFRTTWQNQNTRFRLIPKWECDGEPTAKKVSSPVIYLGLSRLYPIGETSEPPRSRNQKWDNEEDRTWFEDNYANILSIHNNIKSVSALDIAGLSRKRGTGIETDDYGPTANSSGQDNLGQILMSILSFKKLRRDLGDDWDGGLLLIDELDATLHPAAQLRLLKLINKETKECGFQTIFTTHSTTLIEAMSDLNQYCPEDRSGTVEVALLTDANGSLVAKRNVSWRSVKADLFVRPSGASSKPVGVFCEDAEGRWMVNQLLKVTWPAVLPYLDFVQVNFGCDQLLSLYEHDFIYLKDRIIVFDGDVEQDRIDKLPELLRNAGNNIVKLPGTTRPENLIWDLLKKKPDDFESGLWANLDSYDMTWRNVVENGPISDAYSHEANERNRFKKWFKEYQSIFEYTDVVHYWVESHHDEAVEFTHSIAQSYNSVARRTASPVIPGPIFK